MTSRAVLTVFQGRVGDRNPRAMAGSVRLGDLLSARLNAPRALVGTPQPPLHLAWNGELAAARPALLELAATYDALLGARRVPLSVIGRCAAGLATLPVVARHRPDACVVWFDAHADSNTPSSVANPYLGGMVLSAAAGLWDSGLGAGLSWPNVVLVGSRDIDPDEQALIDAGTLRLVGVGPDLPARLESAIGNRPIYVHLDCDVLEPGIVPTEYISPGGLTLAELLAACKTLARKEIVGFELAEFEATWPQTDTPATPGALLDALQPLFDAACRA